ncbi:MAG TPA: class I SAM-dependent methyltransferase [Steroidobacteraceae bacterium]|jgi:SAM-dependent methyltransferase
MSAPQRRSGEDSYRGFASIYDATMGDAAFPTVWGAFERARNQHGITFASACDVGCGTGRFLSSLRRHEAQLFGVDLSAAMLQRAARRLQGTGIRLLRQDMRALQLPQRVDLITCNFCTLNYCASDEDLAATLAACRANLTPGGHLIADVLTDRGPLDGPAEVVQEISLSSGHSRWQISLEPSGSGSVVEMSTVMRDRSGRQHAWRETHRQRWYREPLLRSLLDQSGFKVLSTQHMDATATDAQHWLQFVTGAS